MLRKIFVRMVGDYQFTCPVLEFAQQLAESPDYNKKYAGPRKLISGERSIAKLCKLFLQTPTLQ